MSKDTGGPAFPTQNAHQASNSTWHYEGISMRDYFAAKAMQAYLTAADTGWDFDEMSRAAYEQADAMLKARGEI